MRRHFVERINERSASRQLRRVCLAKRRTPAMRVSSRNAHRGFQHALARWILGFRDAVLQFLVLLHFLFRLSRISLPAVEICQPECACAASEDSFSSSITLVQAFSPRRGYRRGGGFASEYSVSGMSGFSRWRAPVAASPHALCPVGATQHRGDTRPQRCLAASWSPRETPLQLCPIARRQRRPAPIPGAAQVFRTLMQGFGEFLFGLWHLSEHKIVLSHCLACPGESGYALTRVSMLRLESNPLARPSSTVNQDCRDV